MMTGHDRILATRLLPTAPFEVLIDPETEQVVVTWPDLSPAASLVFIAGGQSEYLVPLEPHQDWIEERLGAPRLVEVQAAVSAAVEDHWARIERIKRIYAALDGEAQP